MKNNILTIFEKCKKEKRPALLTYTVAGDNNNKTSLDIINSISFSSQGCIAIELGIGSGK